MIKKLITRKQENTTTQENRKTVSNDYSEIDVLFILAEREDRNSDFFHGGSILLSYYANKPKV